MRIRFRQKQLIIAGSIGGASVLLICLVIGFLYINHLDKKHEKQTVKIEQQLEATQKRLNEETVKVTVVTKDHTAGEKIRQSDLVLVDMPRNLVPGNVLSKEEIEGKYLKIELKKNTPITSSMLFEDGVTPKDLRNQEFRLIELPTKLKKNDFVDVRIKFPTGQDYILLSKKKVEDLANNTVWYQMNEKEILTMSSGIVDAYLNDATIYALSYVDPYMQEKAAVTYPPNQRVLDLIESDPNIVEVAKTELERQYRKKLEAELKAMTDEERQAYRSNKDSSAFNHAKDTESDTSNSDFQRENTSSIVTNDNQLNTVNTDIFKDNNESVPVK